MSSSIPPARAVEGFAALLILTILCPYEAVGHQGLEDFFACVDNHPLIALNAALIGVNHALVILQDPCLGGL